MDYKNNTSKYCISIIIRPRWRDLTVELPTKKCSSETPSGNSSRKFEMRIEQSNHGGRDEWWSHGIGIWPVKLKRMLRQATTAPPSFLPVSRALMGHLHVTGFETFIFNT
jgi:hypothetical protein